MGLKPALGLLAALAVVACTEVPQPAVPAIIPQPAHLEARPGQLRLPAKIDIGYNACAQAAAAYLQGALHEVGVEPQLRALNEETDSPRKANTALVLRCTSEDFRHDDMDESYHLEVTLEGVMLSAPQATGLHRGIQTLMQLWPQEGAGSAQDEVVLPLLEVTDRPRFSHRGMLLDVCRHFFTVEDVKAYIDLLAAYKMNTLHWHLTEDQGWRLAIDAYPLLTEVGGWRTTPEGEQYGGFYSKDDIREVVRYATARHIRIIPEIEMPGHAQAALAAYPELSCTGGPHQVANDWGVFKEIYCAGNDSVFVFLRRVLTEVMALFPSRYIHIGGDEAPKYRWEGCKKCQKRMQDQNLADAHELQSWFIGEIGDFLKDNGKTLIGWDEILEGGLNPDAAVQSWRGTEGGMAAARAGQYAVMSPTSHCYFDYDLKAIDLEKVYSFEPIPEGLSPEESRFILGGECNLWTEHIPDRATLDRQAFPRLIAMSEVLWSPKHQRDFTGFRERLQHHYPRLRARGVQFGAEQHPYTVATVVEDGTLYLVAQTSQEGVGVDADSNGQPLPSDGLKWEVKPGMDRQIGLQATTGSFRIGAREVVDLRAHKGLAAKVEYGNPYSSYYPAGGEGAMVDGLKGSSSFRDGRWQGFSGQSMDVWIDLGEEVVLTHLSIGALQYINAWIFLPKQVSFYAGVDRLHMPLVGTTAPHSAADRRGEFRETLTIRIPERPVRYVRVVAQNMETVPQWHEAAGAKAWLFIDEITLE